MTDWNKMLQDFNKSNIKGKVKLPKQSTQKGETLLFYWQNKGKILQKETIEKVVCERLGIPTKDIQSARHLAKQNGFNILQQGSVYNGAVLARGTYVFLGFDKLNPYYALTRRDESDLDWSEIKKKFDYSCATCGCKEGRPHRKTTELTTLQKGHMDPSKTMDNDNIIPQCSYCNQLYGNRFVFDKVGNVKSMTLEGVLGLPEQQRIKLIRKLKESLTRETQ
mgnify:CR=1 FL=1